MTTDLTEKLKELLMKTPVFGNYNEINAAFAAQTAKQLAPEIEKMMPRWIPVSERLPDEGQRVDVWNGESRWPDMGFVTTRSGKWVLVGHGGVIEEGEQVYWMPIMKGPMG